MHILGIVDIVGLPLAVAAVVLAYRRQVENNPYREGDVRYIKSFTLKETFTTRSLANFKVRYQLELLCARADNTEFNRMQMLDAEPQRDLAIQYHGDMFQRVFNNGSYFLSFELRRVVIGDCSFYRIRTPIRQASLEDGKLVVCEVRDTKIRAETLALPAYRKHGCEVTLVRTYVNIFDEKLIEENYAMLTEKQKEAILADKDFGAFQESLAVAALKLQRDFLENRDQRFETKYMTLETTKAGRGVKIEWKLKEAAGGLSVRGYRKTGGFFGNQFDEQENGELIAHSSMDGDVVEILPENVATFYTFFLLGKDAEGTERYWSPIRFQITVTPEHERNAIEALLERGKKTKATAEQKAEKILDEVSVAVGAHDLIEDAKRNFISNVKAKSLSDGEESEEIARIEEIFHNLREKYDL
jgi:hypothetical protein